MTLPHNLRPSLDVACSAVGDEIAELQARGERIRSIMSSEKFGGIVVATAGFSVYVRIFGFTDEEAR